MNDNKELIDRGTYYEIKDYEPVVNRDENSNVVSVIHCPYIPKSLYNEQIAEEGSGHGQALVYAALKENA
jgi:hypothetical protein